MRFGGIEIRTSAAVSPGEVWFAERIGYEKEEHADRWGWTLTVSERFRVIGKIVGLAR